MRLNCFENLQDGLSLASSISVIVGLASPLPLLKRGIPSIKLYGGEDEQAATSFPVSYLCSCSAELNHFKDLQVKKEKRFRPQKQKATILANVYYTKPDDLQDGTAEIVAPSRPGNDFFDVLEQVRLRLQKRGTAHNIDLRSSRSKSSCLWHGSAVAVCSHKAREEIAHIHSQLACT